MSNLKLIEGKAGYVYWLFLAIGIVLLLLLYIELRECGIQLSVSQEGREKAENNVVSSYIYMGELLFLMGLDVCGLYYTFRKFQRYRNKCVRDSVVGSEYIAAQEKVVSERNVPIQVTGSPLWHRLTRNLSISQLSKKEMRTLFEECKSCVDPYLFGWLNEQKVNLCTRRAIYCVLVRMRKSPKDIQKILGISDGAYRSLKCHVGECIRKKVSYKGDLDDFLRRLENAPL